MKTKAAIYFISVFPFVCTPACTDLTHPEPQKSCLCATVYDGKSANRNEYIHLFGKFIRKTGNTPFLGYLSPDLCGIITFHQKESALYFSVFQRDVPEQDYLLMGYNGISGKLSKRTHPEEKPSSYTITKNDNNDFFSIQKHTQDDILFHLKEKVVNFSQAKKNPPLQFIPERTLSSPEQFGALEGFKNPTLKKLDSVCFSCGRKFPASSGILLYENFKHPEYQYRVERVGNTLVFSGYRKEQKTAELQMNEKATLLTITEPRKVPHCTLNPHCAHNPHCEQLCIFQQDGMVKIRKQIYSATNEVISFDLDGDVLFEKEIIYDYKTNMTNFYTITYRKESLKD